MRGRLLCWATGLTSLHGSSSVTDVFVSVLTMRDGFVNLCVCVFLCQVYT